MSGPGADIRLASRLAGMAVLAAALASCQQVGESSIDVLAPTERQVSFSAEVQPILTNTCALSGCHAPPLAIPGADWQEGQAYGNLVNVPSYESSVINAGTPNPILDRVEPGDPSRSYLLLKITGCGAGTACFGSPMPLQGFLGDADVATIRQWIEQGAPNN